MWRGRLEREPTSGCPPSVPDISSRPARSGNSRTSCHRCDDIGEIDLVSSLAGSGLHVAYIIKSA